MKPKKLIIGREHGDVIIADSTVSDAHAELLLIDGRWHVKDLGSRNGTWLVHGDQHERHSRGPVPMDQTISFGGHQTTLRALLMKAGIAFDLIGKRPDMHETAKPRRCDQCGAIVPSSATTCVQCGVGATK